MNNKIFKSIFQQKTLMTEFDDWELEIKKKHFSKWATEVCILIMSVEIMVVREQITL